MHREAGSCCKNPGDFSSGKLAFIGGKARLVSVATQILAASPRFPPPRTRPQTRREKHLKGAGDSWIDG
ncbi:unnamed protein product [Bubo scandiacus]